MFFPFFHRFVWSSLQNKETRYEAHNVFVHVAWIGKYLALQVARTLSRGRADDLLSERYRIRITRGDIVTLSGLQWLNDEVGVV